MGLIVELLLVELVFLMCLSFGMKQPTSPLVSTPTPAQDVSAPTMGALSAPASRGK